MNAVVEKATAHLSVVFGNARACAIVDECLHEAGLVDVQEASELHKLGTVFMKRGGFFEVVGRFLRVQAISSECAAAPAPHQLSVPR